MNQATEQKTLKQFIKEQGLSAKILPIAHRPDRGIGDEQWNRTARHFHITVLGRQIGGARPDMLPATAISFYFSQGTAITKTPTLADLLDCLASDASGTEGAQFADWVSEYGYDLTTHQAYKNAKATFKACKRAARDLRSLLGETAYLELINEVEKL